MVIYATGWGVLANTTVVIIFNISVHQINTLNLYNVIYQSYPNKARLKKLRGVRSCVVLGKKKKKKKIRRGPEAKWDQSFLGSWKMVNVNKMQHSKRRLVQQNLRTGPVDLSLNLSVRGIHSYNILDDKGLDCSWLFDIYYLIWILMTTV